MQGEVDNYYAWGGEIQDSSKPFNKYLNATIDDALGSVNKKWGTPSCEEAAMTIMKKLSGHNYLIKRVGALNTDSEIWAQDNPEIDKIPREGESLDDYVLNKLDEKDYYAYANSIGLTLTYEEYLEFTDGLDLMLQSDVTVAKLSDSNASE